MSYNPLHSLPSVVDTIPDWDKPEGAEKSNNTTSKNSISASTKTSSWLNAPSWLNSTTANSQKTFEAVNEDEENVIKSQIDTKPPQWSDEKVLVDGQDSTKKSKKIDVDLSDIPEETIEKMRKCHLTLRGMYIIVALLICIAAFISLIGQFNIGLVFMALYSVIFSSLICCMEFALIPVIIVSFKYSLYSIILIL